MCVGSACHVSDASAGLKPASFDSGSRLSRSSFSSSGRYRPWQRVSRVVLDPIEEVVHGPGPHRGRRPHPEREDVRTVRAGRAGRRNGARVGQPQGELVPQHLKRGELTDEVGIDRVVVEQLQDAADVGELHEGVAGSAGAAQLSPEANEDRQLVEALFGSPRVRKVDPQILEAARFALGKLAVPFVCAVAERDEP